jgi:hypothetical protein
MPSTQLVCPHCNSTLTFGAAISSGAAVECMICMKKFTATNPVAVAVSAKSAAAKANPKPAPTTFSTSPMASAKATRPRKQKPAVRRPVEANSNFLVIAVSIAVALLLTGGISFAVWRSMRSTERAPSDPELVKADEPKDPVDQKPLPGEGKKTDAGGGKPLATLSDEDDRDMRAKFQAEMKQVLKRKPPSKIDSPETPWEVDAPPLPAKTIAGLDQKKIDNAISRGIAFLRMTQSLDGGWGGGVYDVGYASLCALTLLECKVPAGDPAILRAAAFVRVRCSKCDQNYQTSLAILFLDRLHVASDRAVIQGLALRIMAAQEEDGGWPYATPVLGAEEMTQLAAFLRPSTPMMKPEALDKKLQGLAVVRNRGKTKGELALKANGPSDNSNTQFAMLALWAARRHGVPTEQSLLAGYYRFAATQHPSERGWGYGGPGKSTNTMTCAGLIGLAIGHGTAPDRDVAVKAGAVRPALQDSGIQSGLQALAPNIGQPSPDPKKTDFPMENLYFLWSVERVAMLYDLDTIGGKDWYGWGAQILIHNQQADGTWKSANYSGTCPCVDTCFALLFLKRSNLVPDLTRNLRLNTGVRDP